MKTVSFHNLGCKVNSYEMEVMQQNFIKSGYTIVPFDSKADVCVINTCTVTNIADRKSRQMLHRARKLNPEAVLVAVGCYVQSLAQNDKTGRHDLYMLRDEGIDLCIGNDRKNMIVEVVEGYIAAGKNAGCDRTLNLPDTVTEMKNVCTYEDMQLESTVEHVRAYIKIQDGCDQFCTYCAIPYVRGRVRSRDVQSVIKEIEGLVKKGYREFVLTGIHVSSYGINHSEGDKPYNVLTQDVDYTNHALLDLIDRISAIDGVERIRLSSLEPRVITDEFLKHISSNAKICPHFHLSLQSGCDDTLKRMNRRYTTDEYLKKVSLVRKYYDSPAVTTDIITGFPGEDEEEFARTVEFVKRVGFYETHIFRYSKRKGTVAAGLPKQNTEAVKQSRSAVLADINERNGLAYRKAHIDKKIRVLIEEAKEIKGVTYMVGYTDDYVMAAFREDIKPGEIVTGTAVDMIDEQTLLARSAQ